MIGAYVVLGDDDDHSGVEYGLSMYRSVQMMVGVEDEIVKTCCDKDLRRVVEGDENGRLGRWIGEMTVKEWRTRESVLQLEKGQGDRRTNDHSPWVYPVQHHVRWRSR